MKTWTIAIIAFILGFMPFLFNQCSDIPVFPSPEPQAIIITDTVFVEKIKIVTVKAPFQPAKIIIQKQVDTVYRKEVEKKDIKLGETFENNKLHIQTIDTAGVIKETVTEIPEDAKGFVIDQEGKVGIKERTKAGKILYKAGKVAKKVGKVAVGGLAVIGAIAIYLLASGN